MHGPLACLSSTTCPCTYSPVLLYLQWLCGPGHMTPAHSGMSVSHLVSCGCPSLSPCVARLKTRGDAASKITADDAFSPPLLIPFHGTKYVKICCCWMALRGPGDCIAEMPWQEGGGEVYSDWTGTGELQRGMLKDQTGDTLIVNGASN